MVYRKTGWMNIYRSGFFHRLGKPRDFNRHAGDIYETRAIDPPDYYVDTVAVHWSDIEDVKPNAADSVPVPLSVTRPRRGVPWRAEKYAR